MKRKDDNITIEGKERMDNRELILHTLHQRGSILQKDLRKELDMGSGSCSRVLRSLEKDELIKRVQVVADGSSTFKIVLASEYGEGNGGESDEGLNLENVMDSIHYSMGMSPCFGCPEQECYASNCVKLELWFLERKFKRQETEEEVELITG